MGPGTEQGSGREGKGEKEFSTPLFRFQAIQPRK